MARSTLLKNLRAYKLDRFPVVVLPLADYERMKEDLEMFHSRAFLRRIAKARDAVKKGRTITLDEAKRRLEVQS